jgi:hypothetical protein
MKYVSGCGVTMFLVARVHLPIGKLGERIYKRVMAQDILWSQVSVERESDDLRCLVVN